MSEGAENSKWSPESDFGDFAKTFVYVRGAEGGDATQKVCDAETIFFLPRGMSEETAQELLVSGPSTRWSAERFAQASLVVHSYREAAAIDSGAPEEQQELVS